MKVLALGALILASSMNVSFGEELSESRWSNAWDGMNNPAKMSDSFEYVFEKLPKSGSLKGSGLGWPGNYWPNNKGGVAHRWSSKNPQNFKYSSPGKAQLQYMSVESINELSPAEKYDLYMGRYDYPLVKRVFSQTRKGAPVWHGICHGVAPASLNHPEPKKVTVTNPDGVEITFWPSDVKALLAFYYAKEDDQRTFQLGKRCFVGRRVPFARRASGCSDVNAGAYHIVLANRLGIEKKSFVADMDRWRQVWNHATREYNSRVLKFAGADRRSPTGTVKRVLVKTVAKYSASIDPMKELVFGHKSEKYDVKEYTYWLDLDYRGAIIGGSWVSSERPDFLWIKSRAKFTGFFSGLNDIYQSNYSM